MILLAASYLANRTAPLLEPLRKAAARGVVLGPPPSPNREKLPYEGTIEFQGMRILVENAKGSTRRGVDPQGKPWATTMTAHYGEFAGTLGVDGDPVDVFVGDDADAPVAYVIHRKWPGTEVYDEDKVVVGVRSAEEAEALFRANYNRPGNLGGVTPWPIEELREYLAHPAHEGKRLDQPRRVRLLLRKSVHRDRLHGGLADKKRPGDFDPEQLRIGTRHETEHTNDEAIAREIAMDHLAEDPDYYRKLEKAERAGPFQPFRHADLKARGMLERAGPPDEWSGAVAGAFTPEERAEMQRVWRAMSKAEQDHVRGRWEASLKRLLKAVIRTPTGADGKVDYDSVPVGASIWVRVTDPHSPLHGRPILLTKRPDHQFALTGGSAAKHIEARRHLVVSSGRARASAADEAGLAARQEAEARNAPVRERQRELRRQARAEQGTAEERFMAALGITRRGLTKDEKASVHQAALEHAQASGLSGRDAESFARHMADGIARKEREFRLRQAAHRLELARHVAAGRDADEAATMAGPAPSPVEYTAPAVDPERWRGMSDPEREATVLGDLERQDTARVLSEMENTRFEDEPAEPEQPEPAASPLTPTPAAHEPVDDTLPTDASGEPPPGFGAEPAGAHAGTPTDAPAGVEEHTAFTGGEHPEPIRETPDVAGPTFMVGGEEEAAPVPGPPGSSPASPARPPSSPILSPEKAREAIEHFRAFAAARKAEKEAAGSLEKFAASESAMPTSVEDLRLRIGAVDDEELGRFLDEYQRQNGGPPDASFYSAMSPHWNDDVGNKLAGAVTRGAASAITGIVGEELGARFDVQRLVDALGPEAAAMAVVHRMREELSPETFGAFVDRLRDANASGQRATEQRAMRRHHELIKQAEDLDRQVRAGDLTSQASVEVLRARNLVEQRENLGTALGSLQASAALYHFADQARGERFRKQPVVINVGSKVALADKLKRLGPVRATTMYHPTLGYQVHTDTEALRKYVGRTEADKADADRWRAVKYDTAGIEPDAEGREWVPGYTVPGFRAHVADPANPTAGAPFRFLADQRNNIEWLHGSGGGLVTMRTGGGKTITSIGVAAKMLHENPKGRHLRIVPDGREEQWANEVRNFTTLPVTVLPAASTKEERARLLAGAPEGSLVVVGHTNAGRYDHEALATTHAWDSIGIDEPQELRAKSGSGKLGAGAKRIMRIPAKNRHALTATPATDHPVEAFDIVNWARPRALGFRTRFERAFSGFGGGTNAQDAALERGLYRELEPHVSGERLVAPHYAIEHADRRVRMSPSQLAKQREIESRVDGAIQAAVEEAKAKKQAGERGYAERSYAALYKDARERAMAKLEAEHRANLSGGDTEHNPKLAAMQKAIGGSAPNDRHVVFVDSPEQRRAVTAMLEGMGHKGKVKNITASAKGDTVKRGGVEVAAIEERKRDWKSTPGGFIIIDRSSASGHNLAEGDHLHVLGNPDDAAQMLQAHGRLGRANREGDFAVHTYRYDDSPFEHARWNRLERQLKVLRATAPGMFVEGKRREPAAAMAKGTRWGVALRRWIARV